MLVALFLLVAVGLTDERKFALRGLTKKGLLLRRLTGIHFHVFNSECTSSWIYQFAELPSVPPGPVDIENQTSVTWYPPFHKHGSGFSYTGWGSMIVSGRV